MGYARCILLFNDGFTSYYFSSWSAIMNSILHQALRSATSALSNFARKPSFWQDFELAFGADFDRAQATQIRQGLIDQEFSLPVQVVPDQDMGMATGAYAEATDTVYLRESFVAGGNVAAISAVIVEELGHAIDSRINKVETPGDEGAIFRLLVGGAKIAQNLLAELQAEDDWATILVDGQQLVVEMAVINGTEGNDTLNGTADADTINGLAGNDVINGDITGAIPGVGDTINGGLGADKVTANLGSVIDGGNDLGAYDSLDLVYKGSDNVRLIVNGDGSGTDDFGTTFQGIEGLVINFTDSTGNHYIDRSADNRNSTFSYYGGKGKDTIIGGAGSGILGL
jgi:hypothetical protein